MRTSSEQDSTTAEKGQVDMAEVAPAVTIEPLPNRLRVDGGIVLDVEGLADSTNLKLAADGHVSFVTTHTYTNHHMAQFADLGDSRLC